VGSLSGIVGVSEVAIDQDVVVFACAGDMDDVLKAVSRFPVHALDVAHTDLEDAFFEILDGPDASGGAR